MLLRHQPTYKSSEDSADMDVIFRRAGVTSEVWILQTHKPHKTLEESDRTAHHMEFENAKSPYLGSSFTPMANPIVSSIPHTKRHIGRQS